jgi:SAM-dependent methyltransferase
MLTEAREKGLYGRLTEARLGDPLPYGTDAYDAVVACGVLTTGHAPASCIDELVRVTRPGGCVVFTLRSDRMPAGYDERIAALLADGRWQLVERGPELQAMPTGEPDVLVRVWAFRVS